MLLKKAILALEQQLLSPEIRSSAASLESLLTDDFTEIGQSGRKYGKSDVIKALAGKASPPRLEIVDFSVTNLAENVVLATYKTVSKEIGSMVFRCSIWVRQAQHGWRMCYHQGTAEALANDPA